jgi:hypothetical protein
MFFGKIDKIVAEKGGRRRTLRRRGCVRGETAYNVKRRKRRVVLDEKEASRRRFLIILIM